MKKLLKCCLLSISAIFCASATHAQLPSRDNFNFVFENNFDNNKTGSYISADFVNDWGLPGGSTPGNVQIITDDAFHKSVMRGNYPTGTIGPSSTHGFTWYSILSNKGEELYFSYDVRFKPGFDWVLGGKIPGLTGGAVTSGQLPTATSGFSTRLVWKRAGSLVFYVYYPDQANIYGDVFDFEGFNFQTGRWYNLTMRVVLNSFTNGTANYDGILEGYVDGKLIFQKTGFRFRRSETIKIERMYICSFFGGNTSEWNATKDEWIDTDNYVAYFYSSKATNVPRGRQINTTRTLLHPYYNFTGTAGSSAPSAPSALAYSSCTSNSTRLNWTDNSTDEAGFKIERKSGTGSYSQLAVVTSNTATYTDNSLAPSGTYTYRVCAYNSTGNSSFSNETVVQTPAISNSTNLAYGKPSIQSATAYGGVASRANDNNTNGSFFDGSVSNTGSAQTPYWQVDLQSVYTISNIEVWNRTDCCGERMANYYVFVSNNPFTSSSPVETKNQAGVWSWFSANYPKPSSTIPVNLNGRYVRIQLANQGELSIAEVKVFGSAATTATPSVPNAPANLSAQIISSASVKLNWSDNSTNETGFRIERSTEEGSFSQVGQVSSNITTFTDNTISSSVSYSYRVYAINATGQSGYSNEVDITSPVSESVQNLALGKPSAQSSTIYGGVSSRGNDNNTNGLYASGSVIHTVNESCPYWEVNLLNLSAISKIEVWNRTDECCKARMTGYYVFVSDNPFSSADPLVTKSQAGVWSVYNSGYPNPSITLPVNRSGKYVRIQLAGQGELNLAELKVFGNVIKTAEESSVVTSVGEESMKFSIFPNPTHGRISIAFDLNDNSQGSLAIYDMSGHLINQIGNGSFVKGTNEFTLELPDLSQGVYLVKLNVNNNIIIRKLLISK